LSEAKPISGRSRWRLDPHRRDGVESEVVDDSPDDHAAAHELPDHVANVFVIAAKGDRRRFAS
jgi:hypothetical protein